MAFILFILFAVLPVMEIYVLIKVGSHIGALNTIILMVVMGVVGSWLARMQGFLIVNKVQTSLNQGLMPAEELWDGMLILAGGILLVIPGFISDILGILCLIPWTRLLIKVFLKSRVRQMMDSGEVVTMKSFQPGRKRYNDIDI